MDAQRRTALIFFHSRLGLCVVYVWLGYYTRWLFSYPDKIHGRTTTHCSNFYHSRRGLCVVYVWLGYYTRWLFSYPDKIHGRTTTHCSNFCNSRRGLWFVYVWLGYYTWITFIRRSRQIINEFWSTPSESQRTDQNSSFFVRWTCVMVCVTGPLAISL